MAKETSREILDVTFEGKEPWEEVRFVFHPHAATLMKPAFMLLFIWAIVGAVIYFYLASWVSAYAIVGGLLLTLLYGGMHLFLWYNTTGIITDYRVIQIRQQSLVNRRVGATMWSNVQSVTIDSAGALASLFGYGNITCDPGGSELTVVLYNVPDVYKVHQIALGLMRKAQEERAKPAGERPAKKVVMD